MQKPHLFTILCLALITCASVAVAGAKPPHAPAHPPTAAANEPAPAAQNEAAPAAQNEAAPDDGTPPAEPTKGAAAADDAMPAEHAPVTMTVGTRLIELTKLDLSAETFNAEFFVSVHCDRQPCKPQLDVANGKLLGKPEKLRDEPLDKEYKMKAELTALLDFSNYPYDQHLLQIVLEDRSDAEQIKYEVDAAGTGWDAKKGKAKLPGWELSPEILGGVIEDETPDGKSVSQVHLYLQANRPLQTATFKTVVPVLIMMFTAAFTLLLKPKSASGRLATATAGLSALVMFQVAQVGSLPPTGCLTLFDKFMIASYLVYLANIAFSIAMVRFEEKKAERMSELMYLVAAGAVPGLAIVMWTAVFAFR